MGIEDGVDVSERVGGSSVLVGTTEGVVLGSVAVTVGRGVEPPHAANRTAVRIMVDNISIRFDMVI